MEQNTKSNFAIPVAIVIAGIIIAIAVLYSVGRFALPTELVPAEEEVISGDLEQMRPISGDDHIRGNSEALITIVEFADMECPFCKRFHTTMQEVMDEYGTNGKVKWVYRHFPLDQLHSKARTEAVAVECAGELGGKKAFDTYLDRFYEITPSNDQTDIKIVLPQIAREIGLNEKALTSCLTSGKYDRHIQDDLDDAIATGGNGTPWSILIAPNGKKYPINGAQPFEAVKQLIELALQEK